MLIVKDFDPREDVVIVPTENGCTFEPSVGKMKFSEEGVNLTGVGLEFSVGAGTSKNTYAQVFIDLEYYEVFGVENDKTGSEDVLNNVVDTGFAITPTGPAKPDELYALYPDASEAAKTALKASKGSQFTVYGAFAPAFTTNPDERVFYPGTKYSDVLNANKSILTPEAWEKDSTVVITKDTKIFGFAGDDLLYGSAGADTIDGGDGDDSLYAFTTVDGIYESLSEKLLSGINRL